MTRRSGGRAVVVVAVGAALAGALTGCGASATHVRNICDDVTQGTARLDRYDPGAPLTALQFALARFDLVEEAVSKARETGLPDDAAATLRTDWLKPAVASMADWDTRLQALRDAVADDRGQAAVDAAFGTALTLGTEGVDTDALRGAGYGECATAFTAPSVASTRS